MTLKFSHYYMVCLNHNYNSEFVQAIGIQLPSSFCNKSIYSLQATEYCLVTSGGQFLKNLPIF